MKKIILSLFTFSASLANAADLVVQQNGPIGTYSTIVSAITAASDGDQIIINNRVDLLPWQGNITINKTLTFLSAVDNVMFWVDGTWTVERASGRKVKIIGMRNTATATNITVNTVAGTFALRTEISIVGSELNGLVVTAPLTSSNINQVSGTNLYVGSSQTKAIIFSYGKLIGNKINEYVELYSDLVNNNDTIWLVGNDIVGTTSIIQGSQYIMSYNNFFSGSAYGLNVVNLKSGINSHLFLNNTCLSYNSGANNFGLVVQNFANTNFLFLNNVFAQSSTSWGYGIGLLNHSAHSSNFYFNLFEFESGPSNTLAGTLGNFQPSTYNLTFNSDRSNNFTNGVNTGSPSNEYLDLNLTRNDVGCWGGSYSFANFFPLNDGKSSKVNFVKTPRIVNQGSTFKAEAIGIDK